MLHAARRAMPVPIGIYRSYSLVRVQTNVLATPR